MASTSFPNISTVAPRDLVLQQTITSGTTVTIPAGINWASNRVLELAHSHPIFGHKRGQATYQMIKNSYFWPGMKADNLNFVHRCSFCQGKHRQLNPVPPRVRPLPKEPFSVLSVDYAGPFGVPGQALKGSQSQEEERRKGYS